MRNAPFEAHPRAGRSSEVEVAPLAARLRSIPAESDADAPADPRAGAHWTSSGISDQLLKEVESHERVQHMLQQARQRAESEGLASAQEQIDALRLNVVRTLMTLEQAVAAEEKRVAQEIVDLALVIARELVGHHISQDRQSLIAAVDEALRQLPADAPAEIRMGPEDARFVARSCSRLFNSRLRLVTDESLAPGGWIIESEHRIVDGSVERRLESVRDSLVEWLREELSGGDVGPETMTTSATFPLAIDFEPPDNGSDGSGTAGA